LLQSFLGGIEFEVGWVQGAAVRLREQFGEIEAIERSYPCEPRRK